MDFELGLLILPVNLQGPPPAPVRLGGFPPPSRTKLKENMSTKNQAETQVESGSKETLLKVIIIGARYETLIS